MEDKLIVEGLETVEDIQAVKARAEAENIEYYVGISKSGQRFGVVGGEVVKLSADEFARNEKFVAKIETEPETALEEEPVAEENSVVEQEENIEEIVESETTVEEVEEEPKELSDEEIEENNRKLAEYDILVAKVAELETRNIELSDEVAKLNGQIDELSLKAELAECHVEPEHKIDLEEVRTFLKENHLISITIDKE